MHFRGLDLNLSVALDTLITERSISRTGEKIHLSQPATSGALARLREFFKDDLSVPVGRKMVLTPLAEVPAHLQTRHVRLHRHCYRLANLAYGTNPNAITFDPTAVATYCLPSNM
jgi:DNA-binding transcriptional LysR family regulator